MRLKEIDFLRGLAVILVLFRHHYLVQWIKDIGWAGVDLFFVLSGFLVSGLLFAEYRKTGTINPWRFLIRRGFKIYPLYYILMLGTIVGLVYQKTMITGHWMIEPKILFAELFFLQNYLGFWWPHTWSLAVEEHFYFGLTLLIFVLIGSKKIEHRAFFNNLVFGVALFCFVMRAYNNFAYPYTHLSHLFPTHLRIDSLFFGVWLAHNYQFNKEQFTLNIKRYNWQILAFSIIGISTLFFYHEYTFFMNSIGLTLIYLSFGGLLILSLEYKSSEIVPRFIGHYVFNLVTQVGVYSYSIYVLHLFVQKYLIPFFAQYWGYENEFPYPFDFVFYFIISISLGIVGAKLVEFPFLKMRDKYFPR